MFKLLLLYIEKCMLFTKKIFTNYFSLLIEVEFCQILVSDYNLYRPMLFCNVKLSTFKCRSEKCTIYGC
jgi:hypothetical protein